MATKAQHRAMEHARALAQRIIIVDGHVDVPFRLSKSAASDGSMTEDLSERTENGDFDYPRALMGGLDAPFMAIFIPPDYQRTGGARAKANALIDYVEAIIAASPAKFAAARTAAEIEHNAGRGLISLPLGIENGAAIESDAGNLQHFFNRGVRYMTLTHAENNLICDSSYSATKQWHGLSPFGEEVVAEMNRLGMMIDVSHVSDDTFFQVAALSKAPVIASHSSCRHFTPGFERNMSDAMITRLAEIGGIIMINFGSTFISAESRAYFAARKAALASYLESSGVAADSDEAAAFLADHDLHSPKVFATVEQVADHIDHVVRLVGLDHVGLGSDFEGVGDSLPVGLKDVSAYPNLFAVLLERNYTDDDIEKISSGNLFRVWNEVTSRAARA